MPGGPAIDASLSFPIGISSDVCGNIYIGQSGINVISIVESSNNYIYTFAGNGTTGYSGDGGPAIDASLNALYYNVCSDMCGNIYIADGGNNVIRKVNTSGIISTFAGNGTAGYFGDGGLAIDASLSSPYSVCSDIYDNIYIADAGNYVIRKVNTSGIISTFAGNGTAGYSGDGGLATDASLGTINSVCSNSYGNIYMADGDNCVIRKVNTSGIISTFAGNGTAGYFGDGGLAIDASLSSPYGVSSDMCGNIYIADTGNQVIRIVESSNNYIYTFAGNGTAGYSGNGGLATNASLSSPYGVCSDMYGNIYMSDTGNNVIRKVNTSGIISTFAGYYTQTPCFLEGSKILTDKGYVLIQDLRKGDLVKTLKNDYKSIVMIGKRDIYNPASDERIKDQLYKCSQDTYPEVFEDLIITGCHSILVDNFKDDEQKKRTIDILGNICVTDRKYRLPACLDTRATIYKKKGHFTIYHLALENDDYYMNYGIYANGLIVETCSKRYLKELSNMTLIQ